MNGGALTTTRKQRARDLAELGYSALAIDMYGEGRNTEHPKDAMSFMQAALKDTDAAKGRFNAGLDLLKEQTQTDTDKLGAVGYCFGGKVVLDMARQGVPLTAWSASTAHWPPKPAPRR